MNLLYALVATLLCITCSSTAAEVSARVICEFESAEEFAPLTKSAESAIVEVATDKGVTNGKACAKITFKKGAQWASVALDGESLKGWDTADALCIDVFTEEYQPCELVAELFDGRSTSFATRCTLPGLKIEKGQHTLSWNISKPRRNEKESAVWESLADEDKVNLTSLTKVKFFTTPPADHDLVIYCDNLRLIEKSAQALEAERKEAEASKTEKVIYFADFEDGRGLHGPDTPFKGNWNPLDANVLAELATPLGSGNESRKALSVKAAKKAPSVCMELPLHHTICEPEHWDGIVSLRVYNGGYESFQMTYSPIVPSDITFHRVEFKTPKGGWANIEIPLDKFLYYGRRPRRGCQLEYLCFIGIGPEQDGSIFQLDDVKLRRVLRQNQPAPKPKAPLPAGVAYFQNFDDAQDFDVESYYPFSRNCNVFRASGGLDADLKPVAIKGGEAETPLGCMQIECYEKAESFLAGRNLDFAGADTVIEFDCCLQGAADFSVVARSQKGKWRTYPKQPEPGKWEHIVIAADELALFGTPVKDAAQTKPAKAERFFALFFAATADKSGRSSVFIDNLIVRTGTAKEVGRKEP